MSTESGNEFNGNILVFIGNVKQQTIHRKNIKIVKNQKQKEQKR